eukprot:1050676-Pleurochrysis_carterae.AAC.1
MTRGNLVVPCYCSCQGVGRTSVIRQQRIGIEHHGKSKDDTVHISLQWDGTPRAACVDAARQIPSPCA